MKMLEEGNEATIASINDLSEDTRKELDDIYLTLCNYLINQSKQLKIKSISLSGLSIIHMNNIGIKTIKFFLIIIFFEPFNFSFG